MAKKAAAKKAKKKTARPKTKHVRVPVPHGASTRMHDLKGLSDSDLDDVIRRAKTAKVGFVILNAPFKVRQVEPVA